MKLSWSLTLLLLTINIGSFLMFLVGFFPSKKTLNGFNKEPILSSKETPKFDKIVLMVVDALRADFLYSTESKFSFVHELINNKCAVPFTAFSTPPTVTLPRLKGITLGTTPNFLDAILNIADDNDDTQGLLNQDNWLYQFKYRNKTPKVMNFYGDDTWLKLFPDFFNNSDGTNSFFVSDFYDVDNNVTRHLDHELTESASWDGLFLHYLGLDHIGHKTGPNSQFMSSKQQEMDGIVRRIYGFLAHSKKYKNTLFIVMGDHGMNEIGNHGGSSSGETNPGLMFISPKFKSIPQSDLKAPLPVDSNYEYFQKVNQIDMIPTLSLLFNLPIPKNNLGIIIRDFLNLFDKSSHHKILQKNCDQLFNLVDKNELQDLSTIENQIKFLTETQQDLVGSASNYSYEYLHSSLAISIGCAILILLMFNRYIYKNYKNYGEIIGIEIGFISYSIHFHGSSLIEEEHHLWWLFSLIFLIYLYYRIPQAKVNLAIILISLRVIKSWCNTGQKFNLAYTTSAFLIENPRLLWSLILLAYFVIAIVIYSQGSLRHCLNLDIKAVNYDRSYFKNDFNNIFAFVGVSVLVAMSFTFKLLQAYLDGYKIPETLLNLINFNLLTFNIQDPSNKKLVSSLLVQLSNYSLIGIVICMIIRLIGKYVRGFRVGILTDLVNLFTLFLINQTKIELIPLFLVFFIIKANINTTLIKSKIRQIDTLTVYLTIFGLLISNLSFFSMGGTNSLATVDLSNSYNGVNSYEIIQVSLLTFISNFIGPIFWSLSFLQILMEPNILSFNIKNSKEDLIHIKPICFKILHLRILINLVFYSISNLQLLVSCYNLRFHLFIWTVFSPKLLYFGVWFILVNGLFDVVMSSLLIAI